MHISEFATEVGKELEPIQNRDRPISHTCGGLLEYERRHDAKELSWFEVPSLGLELTQRPQCQKLIRIGPYGCIKLRQRQLQRLQFSNLGVQLPHVSVPQDKLIHQSVLAEREVFCSHGRE